MGRGRGQGAAAQAEIREFARELAELRADAGDPSGPQLCKAAGGGLSTSGVSELLGGKRGAYGIPRWETVRAFVEGCRRHAEAVGIGLDGERGGTAYWRRRHGELVKELDRLEQEGPVLSAFDPLPAVPRGFTGREADLGGLLALLDPAAGEEQAVLVASVHGMGGMGKTTLGLAVGHEAVRRGLFSGVLFLDLHGYDDSVLDAGQVLDTVLRALGAAPEQIPPGTDQRAALYRARLDARTRAGERVLVLADNASAAEQVQHLVPPPGPHRLLVTSRDDFAAALDASLVDLDVLTPAQAVQLLDAAVRLVLPKDARVAADPAGAARVAALCGHLPLALRIAAGQLAGDRGLQPDQLADELEDTADRLDLLEDGPRAVRGVLERSYRRLAPTHAEMFRLLAVNPGPDLALEAAAAATGMAKLKDVRLRLVALSRASLIRQDPETRRWRMHDLVRAYADELAREDPRRSAVALRRLLEYYDRIAATRGGHQFDRYYVGYGQSAMDLAALDAERANLTAAVHAAREAGHHDLVMSLADNIAEYLDVRRRLEDGLAVVKASLASAEEVGDPRMKALGLIQFGYLMQELGHLEESESVQRSAVALCHECGFSRTEAAAWDFLGMTLSGQGRLEEAELAQRTSLALYRKEGLEVSESNLGLILQELGRFEEAEQAHRAALLVLQKSGWQAGEAIAWHNLGTTMRSSGDLEQAVKAARQAIALFRELDYQYNLGWAADELADTLLAAGHPAAEVRAVREEAAAAHRRTGDEAKALAALAKPDGPS
ncbi:MULTISPECIES: tetratricopeptide repeat protein [Kitasatospora]|uniref:tetratricopeptide repeat protein n=1 Tax=Kitasatospora TaxID=2063 RepID=UPI000315AC35|nr:tetratricopeptide repeat protein [Kitasatospora setae]